MSADRRRKYVRERCHYGLYQNHQTAENLKDIIYPFQRLTEIPFFCFKTLSRLKYYLTVACVFCRKAGWMFTVSQVMFVFYNPEILLCLKLGFLELLWVKASDKNVPWCVTCRDAHCHWQLNLCDTLEMVYRPFLSHFEQTNISP